MEALKHIQLWDIPGVDENDTLDQIVDDILADSDIIFAITPLTGGLPDSFLTPIKRLLRPTQDELVERVLTAQDTLVINSSPPKKHAEICFLISKIDDIMRDMNSRLCYQNTLNHLFFEIKTKLNLDLGDNTESSYQFIPICTRRQSDSMTAFLYGYRSFIEKSRKYFADAVIDITEGRLNYLTRVLHAMFDCDDYRRAVEQADKLYTLFKSGVHNLENEIKCELKEVFDIMCAIIQANLMDLEAKAFVAINDATRKAEINRTVRAMLMDQFKREIENNENEIRKRLARCVAKFFSNMDMNPRHIQLLEEVHQKLITSNPYSVALGQYDARFGQLCAATVENVARSYSDKSSTFELRLRKMGFYAYMSLAILVDPKQAVLIKMEDLVEKGASDTCEYLKEMLMAEVMEKIRSRIYSILMKFEKNPFYYKIQHAREVSNYLSINKHEVTRVYLNILDKKFRLTYPECNVGNAELDRSNSPVYMGYLKHNGENKNIAAKVISLDDFNLQEVRYIDELSHENIPHYYGVRKKDDNADHYEIIMERLDSNLKEYLKWKKAKKELSDRDINFILLQVVQGLAYMHKSGFFHRDIKPHNILVKMNEPLPPRCLIADFGFIHRVPNSVRGTLNYLAPELLEANTDNKPFITMKTDVYALGVTIRDIINTSHIRKQEQFITFWTGIYKQCLQKEPADRPSCSDIIEQHHRLTAC
ncbi:unnamed protein product [Rotaria socialis]|uniref:Protein kinase domain-containing protein n=1 Tax=Rotaria socialis TaxID=392032 RepID=A0A821FD98_9BILA|nr:unnamed protein product [Rotaria socialis]CAF4648968.1 unnamed protein product [Rotaria socialis]